MARDLSRLRHHDLAGQWVIGDSVWVVKIVRRIPGTKKRDHVVGLCDPSEKVIYIQTQPKGELIRTLIHELLHAIEDEYEIEIPHKLVYRLENPIADLILANL